MVMGEAPRLLYGRYFRLFLRLLRRYLQRSVLLLFGFFATMFVLFCTVVGVWLGRKVDSGDDDWLERLRDWKMADYRRWK